MLDPSASPIFGDPNRLQQVVWNLLSNAIKFTGKGGVVRVALERANSHVQISVSDTGQGIEPEFLPHVFERFRQADASASRRHGGLGLGLAIVKHLMELHGGTVHASSAGRDRGSVFTVSLPAAGVKGRAGSAQGLRDAGSGAEAPPEHDPTVLRGLEVLAVDDEPDTRELIRRILADSGADVRTSCIREEALFILENFAPDVIVSDIGMPELDGYEFLRRVVRHSRQRQNAGHRPDGVWRSEDRAKAMRAGFLAHVTKPVEPAELVATVASVVGVGMKTKDEG